MQDASGNGHGRRDWVIAAQRSDASYILCDTDYKNRSAVCRSVLLVSGAVVVGDVRVLMIIPVDVCGSQPIVPYCTPYSRLDDIFSSQVLFTAGKRDLLSSPESIGLT